MLRSHSLLTNISNYQKLRLRFGAQFIFSEIFMRFSTLAAMAFALAGAAWSTNSYASTLTVGTGWVDDTVDGIGIPSEGSPVTFTLSRAGVFSLSDGYNTGDVYTIAGSFSGVSTFTTPTIPIPLGLGDTSFDSYFYDDSYSHFQAALGAGTYTISISGDGAGGIPAGFAYRADLSTVPLPASAPMFGAALIGLAGLGYAAKRKKVAVAAA